jgi:hypothetical protein
MTEPQSKASDTQGAVLEFQGALRLRAELLRWDGTELVVRGDAPAPPGARLDAAIVRDGARGASFRMKAIRCRKLDAPAASAASDAPARFEITMRVLELSRIARDELGALAPSTDVGAR